jgi:hypothetical protein
MSISTEFRDLIKDFEKYKTTNTDFHAGDLIEHSTWAAFYVNDLFTNLDMDNPLHKVWKQTIVDEAERNGVTIDYQKVLILSAFLHDIGKGGGGKTTYYDKPDHEMIGATYINMKSYRDVNGDGIDLEQMFNDFNLTQLEIDIITVLVEGHWLIGKVITKPDKAENFVKEFEKIYKAYINDPNMYLFKLVAMMQLIICIADVMATKKYEGHTVRIDDFPQIPFVKDGPHIPKEYMYTHFKYDNIIAKFVPLVYKYLDKNYSGGSSVSPIEGIISNISSVPIDFVESALNSLGTLDDNSRDRIISASILNKRYDIATIFYIYTLKQHNINIMNALITELLNEDLLEDFITYIKGENTYKPIVSAVLNNIIINNISEGLTPFLITHREFLTLETLQKAKESYIEAKETGNNELEAEIIYNEIKGNYKSPDGFFKDEKHKEFCEEIKPENYPEPLIETTKKTIFKIPSIIRGGFKPVHLNNPPQEDMVDLKQLLTYDNYGGQVPSLFGDDFTLDMDWVYECIKYMKGLPIEDKYTILGYTYNGDEFINLLLINNIPKLKTKISLIKKKGNDKYKKHYFPIFFQLITIIKDGKNPRIKRLIDTAPITLLDIKNVINNSNLTDTYLYILEKLEYFTDELYAVCIKMAALDLKRILDNAPAMTKTSILYRGVKDKYYYSDPSRKTFQTNTFISTSFNPEAAFEFADKKCCFKKIIAGPGTRGLFIEAISQIPGEREILLNVGTKFNIIEDKDKEYFAVDERNKLEDICSTKGKEVMNITTMEVIP